MATWTGGVNCVQRLGWGKSRSREIRSMCRVMSMGGCGAGKVDLQEPRLILRRRANEIETVACQPVVAVGVLGQGRREGGVVAVALGEILDVHDREAALVEICHVRITRLFSAADGVVLA